MNGYRGRVLVWLGLLALLAVSVATAAYQPAPVSYVIVGGCAAGMAGLILVVFMGLRRADGWQRVFALGGWLWLGFLVFLTAVDVLGR